MKFNQMSRFDKGNKKSYIGDRLANWLENLAINRDVSGLTPHWSRYKFFYMFMHFRFLVKTSLSLELGQLISIVLKSFLQLFIFKFKQQNVM